MNAQKIDTKRRRSHERNGQNQRIGQEVTERVQRAMAQAEPSEGKRLHQAILDQEGNRDHGI